MVERLCQCVESLHDGLLFVGMSLRSCLVRDDERSAGDLASEFGHLSRPAVSQHLQVLQSADLVTVRRAGNHQLYRVHAEGLTEMRAFIDEMWTDRLARLKDVAEAAERSAPRTSLPPSS